MKKEQQNQIIKDNWGKMTLDELGAKVGMTGANVRYRAKRLGLEPQKQAKNVDVVEQHRETVRNKKDINETKKALERLVNENDKLKKELEVALSMKVEPIHFELKESTSLGEAVAVVLASDWHLEETVRPETVNGLNTFTLSIAEKRVKQFFQNTLKLVQKEQNATEIKTLVLALLGDFISGNIHDELLETCSLRPMEAIILAEDLIAGGIDYLLANSELNIIIPCHVGNHTRITRRVHIATEAGNSLETMMYYHLRKHYANNPRVQFYIAEGYLSYLTVYDYTICFQHGHAVKFGGGVGGLTIPLNKAIAQWEKLRHADLYCLGHWHQFLDTGNAIVNGSVIGYNAFAVFIKAGFERPKQSFFLIDRKRKCKTVVCPILFDI